MAKYRTQYGETVPFTQLGGHPSQSKGFNLPSASHMSSGITEEFKEGILHPEHPNRLCITYVNASACFSVSCISFALGLCNLHTPQ